MPGRLKSLELHGYKTFAARTEFVFAEGITVIVGPNGSGKSNIADALRWVLGEQSFSLLRGKKTEDMIFAGSEGRPRAGMASATILFDNSDGWLPIDFAEVAITRRAYRDGENEYLLNGQRVRLKDVSELLAQSGLAERTYTVIGQGLVDAALALKAEERRRLFEEAAGIGLYRARREEALRRLDTTRRNLERAADILAELQPRLRSLERQARRAQEYEQVRADLRAALREWYGYHWHRAQEALHQAQEASRQQEGLLEAARQGQAELERRLGECRQRLQEIRARLGEAYRQMTEASARRARLGGERAVAEERERLLRQQRQEMEGEAARLEEEVARQARRLEQARAEIEQLRAEQATLAEQAAAAKSALRALRQEQAALEQQAQAAQERVVALAARQAQLRARLASEAEQQLQLQKNLQGLAETTQKLEGEAALAEAALQAARERVGRGAAELQAAEQALEAHRQTRQEAEAAHKDRLSKLEQVRAQQARLRAQLEVLEQAEQRLSGYTQGAQVLLRALREGRLGKGRGALGAQFEVPEHLETAIAAALGEYVDAVVLEQAAVDRALELLAEQAARGVLLPLDGLTPPRALALEAERAPGGSEAVLGVAARLVQTPPELRPAADLLLGQVLVVRDREAARQVLKSAEGRKMPQLRVVTLKGELFHAAGPVTAGAGGQSLLSRPRLMRQGRAEMEGLEAQAQAFSQEVAALASRLDALQTAEAGLRERLAAAGEALRKEEAEARKLELEKDKLQGALGWQRQQRQRLEEEARRREAATVELKQALERLEMEMEEAQQALQAQRRRLAALDLQEAQAVAAQLEAQAAGLEKALAEARRREQEQEELSRGASAAWQAAQERGRALSAEVAALEAQREPMRQAEQAAAEEILRLEAMIRPAEAALAEAEREQNALLNQDAEARQGLSAAEHRYAQARILLAKRQEALDSLRRRIEDDFGLVSFEYADTVSGPKPLPLGGMVEELPLVREISPELEEVVQRQRAQLRRMGPINPEAQAEYREVKERYEFMNEQIADLKKAEADILEVIAELDLLMEREFRRTFEAVAQEFRQIFSRLFGGGSARLVLTEPEDLSETGIEIEARLPGRREQGLSLLSGGERSLTAAALVFALLRVSPTPFCVLDEVDAMLDEANVGRFRDLLLELSQKTQFIVITHNRNTVQAAEVIYGVTMGRDSASQVVSLRLDEVGERYGV